MWTCLSGAFFSCGWVEGYKGGRVIKVSLIMLRCLWLVWNAQNISYCDWCKFEWCVWLSFNDIIYVGKAETEAHRNWILIASLSRKCFSFRSDRTFRIYFIRNQMQSHFLKKFWLLKVVYNFSPNAGQSHLPESNSYCVIVQKMFFF